MTKKAHQFVTALSYGDAIGDYTLEIQRILRANGYESEIFSEVVHPRMAKYCIPLMEYQTVQSWDHLMIVHFSIGSELGNYLPWFEGRKLMIYHNITPHDWFIDINSLLAYQCFVGRRQLKALQPIFPVSLGDSEYNRLELESLGYSRTGVLPIRLHFDKFEGVADPFITKSYDDDRTNIIVVGRVIPNKKLEDCLKAFAYYQKFIQPRSRLIFVGLSSGFEPYLHGLRSMISDLRVQEVVLTNHVTFEELLAFYRLADALMIMSEHEGFCVPLMEAFYMKVPVLAWGACAIPYTAGAGAVLVQGEKDFAEIGELLNRLCSDNEFRNGVIAAQTGQLERHQNFPFENTLLESLETLQQLPVVGKA